MKVILLQDVAKVGRRYEVADVPTGYALNRLIPQKLAEPATKAALKQLKQRSADIEAQKAADAEAFAKAVEKLKNTTLTVTVDANEQGHMFQALKADVIVAAAKEQGAQITEEQVIMPQPIKEVGEHVIELHDGEEKSEVTVTVEAH